MAQSTSPSVIPKAARSQTMIMPVGALSLLCAANPAMARRDARSAFRRAVGVSDSLANGVTAARPEHMPVAQPTKFDLIIDLTTAIALGLTCRRGYSPRAEVIEWPRSCPSLARLRHAGGPCKGLLVGEDRKWPANGQNDAIDPWRIF